MLLRYQNAAKFEVVLGLAVLHFEMPNNWGNAAFAFTVDDTGVGFEWIGMP